jgi:hypothetical protein
MNLINDEKIFKVGVNIRGKSQVKSVPPVQVQV